MIGKVLVLSWCDQDDPPHSGDEEFNTRVDLDERLSELIDEFGDELEYSIEYRESQKARDARLRREGAIAAHQCAMEICADAFTRPMFGSETPREYILRRNYEIIKELESKKEEVI